jgi:hypothetical protein
MRFKNLYCNGCSTMAGGGLEPMNLELLKYYKDTYGVEWKSERDIMWPKLVANHFEMQICDYSKSGAGIERFIRETYKFINDNSEIINETLFFIECPIIWNKVDVWSNKENEYIICNTNLKYDERGKALNELESINLSKDYFYQTKEEGKALDDDIKSELTNSMIKTWNPKQYTEKIMQNLVGLISFMKLKKLEFYILPSAIDINYLRMNINDIYNHFLNLEIDGEPYQSDFHNWQGQRYTISKETNNIFIDTHGGYFAHKRWAEEVIKKLKEKYE